MRLFLLLITLSECRKNDISSCDKRTFADNEYPVCSTQKDSFNTYELSGEEGTNLTFLIGPSGAVQTVSDSRRPLF